MLTARTLCICTILFLAGCQTSSGSFCAVSSPIRLSAETVYHLSDQEVTDILAHNEKGRRLCGWRA